MILLLHLSFLSLLYFPPRPLPLFISIRIHSKFGGVASHSNFSYRFNICIPNYRTFTFATDSRSQRDTWLVNLGRVIEICGGPSLDVLIPEIIDRGIDVRLLCGKNLKIIDNNNINIAYHSRMNQSSTQQATAAAGGSTLKDNGRGESNKISIASNLSTLSHQRHFNSSNPSHQIDPALLANVPAKYKEYFTQEVCSYHYPFQ